MESFGSLAGKKNGSSSDILAMLGSGNEGKGARKGARQNAFEQVFSVLDKAEAEELTFEQIREMLVNVRDGVSTAPNGSGKPGVIRIRHYVGILSKGAKMYAAYPGNTDDLKDNFTALYHFVKKSDARKWIDEGGDLPENAKQVF